MRTANALPRLFATVVGLGFLFALTAADAQAEVNFKGKKVQIVVPSKEGGGSDRMGRLFQPFFHQYLPGKPTTIVVNKPGGSGVKGSNWFERDAPRDGTAIFSTGTSVYTSYLFAGKKVKYDLKGWNPILLAPFGTCFYARQETGVTGKNIVSDIKALQKKDRLLMGAKNPTSSELRAFLPYDILDIKGAKPVYGLSSGGRRKGTQRGELQLGVDSTIKCRKEIKKLKEQYGVISYMTLGFVGEDGKITRDPAFPELPHVLEAYKQVNGKELTGMKLKTLKSFINMTVTGNKTLWLPKGVSEEVQQTYVATLKKIFRDAQFKKLTAKTLGVYPQSIGKKAKKAVMDAIDFSPETMKWMNGWIKEKMVGAS
ncbi:MAG: hypothetical protein RIB59_14110 [Rhodospirillales bacterium]